jgi:transposase-like protein
MKPNISPAVTRTRTSPEKRRQILSAFERSGLSAAVFARQHGIGYSTLCAWRSRQAIKPSLGFAEVEWVSAPSIEGVVLELGRRTRVRLTSREQIELAAALLERWEATC